MANRSVGELRKWLGQFPDEYRVWGYEGEVVGIVVEDDKEDHTWVFANDGEDQPKTCMHNMNRPCNEE